MLGIHKLGLLLIVGTSSVVFIEPAPTDILMLGFALFFFITGLKPPRGISTPLLLLCLMFAGFAVASAFGEHQELAYKALWIRFYMILIWLFFASIVHKHPEQAMHIIWHAYIFAGLIAVIWGFLEYFGYIAIEDWEGGLRAKGPFKDPNVYGPFLVPVAMFSLYKSIAGRQGLLYLPLATIFMLGILLSFSRGAWINTTLSLIIITTVVLLSKQNIRNVTNAFVIATFGVIIIFSGLVYLIQNETVASRFEQRTTIAQNYDLKEGGRFDTQKKVLTANLANPLGYGAGSTEAIFGLVPHNIYLHILSEGGWLSFLALISFVFITIIKAVDIMLRASQKPENLLIVMACVFGLILQSFFIDSTHWRHLYMLFGLLWGLMLAEQHTRQATRVKINAL